MEEVEVKINSIVNKITLLDSKLAEFVQEVLQATYHSEKSEDGEKSDESTDSDDSIGPVVEHDGPDQEMLESDALCFEYSYLSQTVQIQCLALLTHESLHIYFGQEILFSLAERFGRQQGENMLTPFLVLWEIDLASPEIFQIPTFNSQGEDSPWLYGGWVRPSYLKTQFRMLIYGFFIQREKPWLSSHLLLQKRKRNQKSYRELSIQSLPPPPPPTMARRPIAL
ncbi:hypothetical protein HOY80DRAFT_1030628 [Tuber brumale]|nr:hypothetical protein HOY80DRAFT_1030628 [Tuber brumale]